MLKLLSRKYVENMHMKNKKKKKEEHQKTYKKIQF